MSLSRRDVFLLAGGAALGFATSWLWGRSKAAKFGRSRAPKRCAGICRLKKARTQACGRPTLLSLLEMGTNCHSPHISMIPPHTRRILAYISPRTSMYLVMHMCNRRNIRSNVRSNLRWACCTPFDAQEMYDQYTQLHDHTWDEVLAWTHARHARFARHARSLACSRSWLGCTRATCAISSCTITKRAGICSTTSNTSETTSRSPTPV